MRDEAEYQDYLLFVGTAVALIGKRQGLKVPRGWYAQQGIVNASLKRKIQRHARAKLPR